MKIFFTLPALLLLSALTLQAQEELATESKPADGPAVEKKEAVLEKPVQAAKTFEARPLTYRGFFVELSRAEDKKQMLSLRQPNDAERDLKNVYRDARTNRPKGFVLFALDF